MDYTTEELDAIFAERYRSKRRLGIPASARGSSEETDIESGHAEYYAIQKLHGELNAEITLTGDGGYDFIYKGYRVDVKWLGKRKGTDIPREDGRIIVDLHKIDTADIYVAVSGSKQSGFHLIGWCSKADLLKEPLWVSSYPDDHGVYERYAIHSKKLRQFKHK